MGEATILSFNLPEVSERLLAAICNGLELRLTAVPRDHFSLPLGALVGLPCASPAAVNAGNFDDPMLVMCNLDEAKFNAFLQALRFSGMPRVDLKAVLTPTNVAWNAVQLHDELLREHRALHGRRG